MSKILGKLQFIGHLPQRGGKKFPVSLTFEMYAASIPDAEPTLVLTLPGYRGGDEEVGWYTPTNLRRDLAVGRVFNEMASVHYEVDVDLISVWLDSLLLGL